MRRRWVLTGVWVLSTLAATLVAWGAVRLVADQVAPGTVAPLPTAVALSEGQESAPEPSATTQAYDLVGGVVTVRYQGTSTRLVEASPNSGFVVEVNDGGPGKVDVRFRSDEHESRFVTRLRDGNPDPQREERPR